MTRAAPATTQRALHRSTRRGVHAPSAAPTRLDVTLSAHRLALISITAAEPRAQRLLDAAADGPDRALPYQQILQQRFGQPLDWIRARTGPEVDRALDQLDAQAAN